MYKLTIAKIITGSHVCARLTDGVFHNSRQSIIDMLDVHPSILALMYVENVQLVKDSAKVVAGVRRTLWSRLCESDDSRLALGRPDFLAVAAKLNHLANQAPAFRARSMDDAGRGIPGADRNVDGSGADSFEGPNDEADGAGEVNGIFVLSKT
jgi:hypothetical protein